ncbi:MAG TPA: tetratricopeptide repeat protein [Deltaproteobacteria bacterium]|jgi:tetratricopeptide (TPR) repeat protein|nr:tetratricopeptide repeat protein [Deltaproteobacteria bacterium]HQJ07613.1 tetratricopeptide repeat protein [Deltaproteobacteria bacterium]
MKRIIVCAFIAVLAVGCAASFKEKRALSKPMVSIAMEKIQKNDLQGAIVELRRALDANPSDPEVYYAFAMAYLNSQKLDKALENADKAVKYADKLELDHPGMKSEAYNLKGTVLVSMGKKKEAISAFQNAVKDELYATPEYAYYNISAIEFDMKRYDEAQKAAQKALDHNPHYAPAWKIMSQVYLEQGDENQAINALRHAILEYPGYTEAHWDLAQILIRRGNTQEGIKSLNEAVRLDPNGPFGVMAREKLQELGVISE